MCDCRRGGGSCGLGKRRVPRGPNAELRGAALGISEARGRDWRPLERPVRRACDGKKLCLEDRVTCHFLAPLFDHPSVPEHLNCFKCDCGALTAEGREACGDGMSGVAKQGDSPTAAGQAAQGRLAIAPRAKAWAALAPNTKRRRMLARQRKQTWRTSVFSLVFMTDAWSHELQQGPVPQISDGVTASRAMACANGRCIWPFYNLAFTALQNALFGILYLAYFARPNAQGKRRRKERSDWREPTRAMKMPKAWSLSASA
jgi:hypothetical protein